MFLDRIKAVFSENFVAQDHSRTGLNAGRSYFSGSEALSENQKNDRQDACPTIKTRTYQWDRHPACRFLILPVSTVLLAVAMLVILCPQGAFSQTWKPPCQVPPDIAFSVDPNVLLLMDFSGSMQEETYYPPSGYYDYNANQQVMNEYDGTTNTITSGTYDPTKTYYGLFDSTQVLCL